MCCGKLLSIAVLSGLALSACDHRVAYNAVPSATQSAHQSGTPTDWQPSWNTAPDKSKTPRSVLVAKIAFLDPGFRGSPSPQTENEKKQAEQNQQQLIGAFRSSHECFGTTLTLQKPPNADFGLQYFEGLDGRTERYQWVLYRMDTLGAVAFGEGTGVNTKMGLDGAVKSICSSIRDAVTDQGGTVEE